LKVQLTWDANTALTYEVSRAEAVWPKGVSSYITNVVSVGSFSTPVVVKAEDYVQGKAVYVDTGLTVRKSYLYKVVPIKNGVRGNPSYGALNKGAYSTNSYLSVQQAQNYHGLGFEISDTGTYWEDSPVIKIYRRRLTNPQTPYAYLTGKDITAAAFKAAVAEQGYCLFVDDYTTLVENIQYQYKFVVTLQATEFEDKATGEVQATAAWLKLYGPVSAESSWWEYDSSGNATYIQDKDKLRLNFISYNNLYYKRAPISVRYRRSGTTDWTTTTGATIDDEGYYILTGLSSGTMYYIEVKPAHEEDSSYVSASATTNY
jgi:hypothetical protein